MAYVRLNLLLMGKTGHGKSLTGNSILGRRAFIMSSNVESVTKEVKEDFETFENYSVKVIDGPGIKDTAINAAKDQETAAANMAKALAMCNGGVDAFLFVYKYGNRFSEEEKKALEGVKQIFGEDYFKHLIVVVTMGDNFRDDMEDEGQGDITFRDWCRQQTGPFKDLLDDCNGRFILLNNKEKDENAMNKQRKEIIELANQLHKINGRYTSDAFKQAKVLRDRYIIEQKVPILREQIQEKCSGLSAALQTYIDEQTGTGKDKIKNMIADTKKEIEDQDKGTNLLKPLLVLVEKVEENLNDVEQLKKLTQELEEIRKAKTAWTAFGSFCASGSGLAGAVGGLSLWTALLAFTVPPVGVALAAGAAAVSGVATGINYLRLSDREKTTKKEQDKINNRLGKSQLVSNKK